MNLVHKLRSATTYFAMPVLAATLLATAASAQTTTWKIDPAHSGIQFQIRHMGVSNVRGSFSKITGDVVLDDKDVTRSTVNATIDATTVTTSNEARDKHLKSADFFNVEKFPTLTFKSTGLAKVNGSLTLTGDLTLDGVTKPVTLLLDGPAPAQKGPRGGQVSGFSATGAIHRTDFNFGSKFAQPILGDDVKFTIDIEMDKP